MNETRGGPHHDPAAAPSEEADADERARRLAAMADLPQPAPALTLATGHTATVAPNEPDRLTIRGPAGDVELSIRFTKEGPILRFAAAAIDLESRGDIRLDCDRLEVRARERIDLASAGDLRQTAGGHCVTEGQAVTVHAQAGKVEIEAADDVDVHGRRILLNS